MFKLTKSALQRRHSHFRYFYFLVSGCTYVPFFVWVQRGEPNPFVKRDANREPATISEIHTLFREKQSELTPLV